MTLIPIDATAHGLAGLEQLDRALSAANSKTRITVMIHGFNYQPGRAGRCPHRFILARQPVSLSERSVSWPVQLELGAHHIGIAFGWDGSGSLWRAWKMSALAGHQLAQVIARVAETGRKVDIIAHSLGARVALAAIAQACPGGVGTAILITPAEFQRRGLQSLQSPAGATAQVLNVISRQNMVFDRGLEWLIAPHRFGQRSLGMGLAEPRANWFDLQIDDDANRFGLQRIGYPIAAPKARVCHWSGYVRHGLFALYRDILASRIDISTLRTCLAPATSEVSEPALCHDPLSFGPQVSF